MTDEQGNVIARHDFMPFGEEINPSSASRERKLFTGQERDFETGLDYFNARQYRPDLGQFTAPDPLSRLPEPVGSQALGSYTYVSNSPLDSVDPSGLWGFNIGFGGITSGAGGVSFWGYAGGGSWAGPSGWSGSGLSLGPLGGISFSFLMGASFGSSGQPIPAFNGPDALGGGAGHSQALPSSQMGAPLSPTEKAELEPTIKFTLDVLDDLSRSHDDWEYAQCFCRRGHGKPFAAVEFPVTDRSRIVVRPPACPSDSRKIADLHNHPDPQPPNPYYDEVYALWNPDVLYYMKNRAGTYYEYTGGRAVILLWR